MSELRERAKQRRRPFREVLDGRFQRGLRAPPPPARKRAHLQTHRPGIRAACEELSLNQLYDQLEAEGVGTR